MIYLTAVGENGTAARDSAAIEVVASGGNRSPQVTIASPQDGSSFSTGAQVTFLGMAIDPEEGRLTGESLSWFSSVSGTFGNGDFLTYEELASGRRARFQQRCDRVGIKEVRKSVGSIEMGERALPYFSIESTSAARNSAAGAPSVKR